MEDRRFINTQALSVGDNERECGEVHDAEAATEIGCRTEHVGRVSVKRSPCLQVYHNGNQVALTLDSGATANMIRESTARALQLPIDRTSHVALQADGTTPLPVIGEIKTVFRLGKRQLSFSAVVVRTLDSAVLAGVPFFVEHDISLRPARNEIIFGDGTIHRYATHPLPSEGNTSRILRAESPDTIWPGDYLELPTVNRHAELLLEPMISRRMAVESSAWPRPQLLDVEDGKICVHNDTTLPVRLRRHDHIARLIPLISESPTSPKPTGEFTDRPPLINAPASNGSIHLVQLDPDSILDARTRRQFAELLSRYHEVFNNSIGLYNGHCGHYEAVVNMGPTSPPQRKGRLPQYSRNRLVELQQKFDELEDQGVFRRPEDLGVAVEYLNPSFLVNKQSGGSRLVTAFSDVARYCKPQPSLLPDVESTIRKVARWKYLIKTDLTSAYYQIPLSKSSMKYCGVVTPFKGTRVYTRCAMGMPGSETALEELMCRVAGTLLQDGKVVKIADDIYCGGATPNEALRNYSDLLATLSPTGLRLSAGKTIICPKETTLLGWVWKQGSLRASSHRVSTLSSCEPPKTVKGLRSFIGAYKTLSKVVPNCSRFVTPLDSMVAGRHSSEALAWSTTTLASFHNAQKHLGSNETVTLPTPTDELWIVTDASPKERGLAATLYSVRGGKTYLSGYFSAKLRDHQRTWIPCELEALSIAAALKHFSPYILQSSKPAGVLTDSKPCVQAVEKLRRGEFSTSPRVYSFLAAVCQYQCFINHLPGSNNILSDFSSRHAPECKERSCQICKFVEELKDEPIVQTALFEDITRNKVRLPYTNRQPWFTIQAGCGVLRRTHAHLTQGTRPSKKDTKARDVKRYLRDVQVARDGLLIVRDRTPLGPTKEKIVVPRNVLPGILTSLHLKLNHPTASQLKQVVSRYFYALDLQDAVARASKGCHQCHSLRNVIPATMPQTTTSPPACFGERFAADVLRREKQCILVVRECVSSYTTSTLIPDERAETLRNALIALCIDLRPLDGPNSVIRTDGAPAFSSLQNDAILNEHRLTIEIGRAKNINKNPVAERAVQELSKEILRIQGAGYHGGPITPVLLHIATANLNTRIRGNGISSREIMLQRDQFTNHNLGIDDQQIIRNLLETRIFNHPASQKSKSPNSDRREAQSISVGDIVYLHQDRQKHRGRDRYLVLSVDGEWCDIKRFASKHLGLGTYRVRQTDCYRVQPELGSDCTEYHSDSEDSDIEPTLHRDTSIPPPVRDFAADSGHTEMTTPEIDTLDRSDTNAQAGHDLPTGPHFTEPLTVSPEHDTVLRRSTRIKRRPIWQKDYVLD